MLDHQCAACQCRKFCTSRGNGQCTLRQHASNTFTCNGSWLSLEVRVKSFKTAMVTKLSAAPCKHKGAPVSSSEHANDTHKYYANTHKAVNGTCQLNKILAGQHVQGPPGLSKHSPGGHACVHFTAALQCAPARWCTVLRSRLDQ